MACFVSLVILSRSKAADEVVIWCPAATKLGTESIPQAGHTVCWPTTTEGLNWLGAIRGELEKWNPQLR